MGQILDELREYLSNATQEQLDKDWEELKKYENVGPTAKEYIESVEKVVKNSKLTPWNEIGQWYS